MARTKHVAVMSEFSYVTPLLLLDLLLLRLDPHTLQSQQPWELEARWAWLAPPQRRSFLITAPASQ
jgi:hypothetical protein